MAGAANRKPGGLKMKVCWYSNRINYYVVTADDATSTINVQFTPISALDGVAQVALNMPATANSYFTVARSLTVLSVSSFELNATRNDTYITIYWKTTTELNNKGFEIERSTDGVRFEKISFTPTNVL